jgi:hypothetical protein
MREVRFGIIIFGVVIIVAAIFPVLVQASSASTVSNTETITIDTNSVSLATVTPAPNFVPKVRTIWQADPQLDKQTGQCKSVPINYCSQLVAITPSGRGFLWKGQELRPYYVYRVKPNVYTYSGRNSLGDGRIKLTLEFTSLTTFHATQVLTLAKEPTCKHTMEFSGTFLR